MLVGAMRVQLQPGRSAVIAAPSLLRTEATDTAVSLLAHVLEILRNRDVQVVQALVDDQQTNGEILRTGGLAHVGELHSMVCLATQFPQTPPSADVDFHPCVDALHARLARVVQRTYAGSLDCPAADGLRSIDDVLAGYRGSGPLDPASWLIANQNGTDIGCLIVTEEPAHDQTELTYMGIVPEARGRGLGLSLVRHAQWMTRVSGRARMVLAVDAKNEPAKAIYAEAGFIRWSSRQVFLRAL